MKSVKPETLNPADEETEGSKLAGQVWQQQNRSLAHLSRRTTVLSLCFWLLVFERSIILVLNVAIRDLKQQEA
jgi:hypothetical protein